MRPLTRSRSGITLVEITVTITVIFLLMAAVFLAIDPLKRTAQARNARRAGDIEAIAKAAAVRTVRAQPLSMDDDPMTWQMIGTATEGCDMLCGPAYSLHTNDHLPDSSSNFVEVPKEFFDIRENGKFSFAAWVMQKQLGRTLFTVFTNDPPNFSLPRRGFVFGWLIGTPFLAMYEDLVDQGDLPESGAWHINPIDALIDWRSHDDIELEFSGGGLNSLDIPRHIIVTYDGTDPQNPVVWFYVNGKKYTATKNAVCETGGCTTPTSINIASGKNYAIGNGLIGSALFIPLPLAGLVDDMRVYDGILTDDEVMKIFEGEKFSDRPGLTLKGRWAFNEPPGYREGYAKNEVDSQFDGVYKSTQGAALPGRVASFSVPGGAETLPACLDASSDLVSAGYLPTLPFDPKADQSTGITGYAINRIGGSVVTRACNAEGEGPRATGDPRFIEAAH